MLQSLIQDGLVDYIAMDIKAPLAEEAYCRVIGVHGFMDEVKKSIDIIRRGSVAYEFRCTVIPSFHLPQDIFRVAEELCGSAKLKLQKFNPAHTLDPLLHTSSSYSYEDLSSYQQRVDQIISQQVH